MRIEVRDGARSLTFEGELLAESSSKTDRKDRWAEFKLYLTTGGRYVLAGAGRTRNAGERDHEWAQVSDDPSAIIEKLTMYDEHGSRYLPYTARTLLESASERDERLREAYLAPQAVE